MQHRFKIQDVDVKLLLQLQTSPTTQYLTAMTFQLGCAIGELIAMGMPPERLLASCDELIQKSVEERVKC